MVGTFPVPARTTINSHLDEALARIVLTPASSVPVIPPGQPWKEGVARALGYPDHRDVWRRALAAVSSYTDVEVPLLRAVEELIDFVTAEPAEE